MIISKKILLVFIFIPSLLYGELHTVFDGRPRNEKMNDCFSANNISSTRPILHRDNENYLKRINERGEYLRKIINLIGRLGKDVYTDKREVDVIGSPIEFYIVHLVIIQKNYEEAVLELLRYKGDYVYKRKIIDKAIYSIIALSRQKLNIRSLHEKMIGNINYELDYFQKKYLKDNDDNLSYVQIRKLLIKWYHTLSETSAGDLTIQLKKVYLSDKKLYHRIMNIIFSINKPLALTIYDEIEH